MNDAVGPTPEQLAEAQAAAKAKAKADKLAAKQLAKAEREQKSAAKKAEKAEAKRVKDEARAKAKADKAAAKAAKSGPKMPEQNGVRRPKDGTKCGNAWKIFDDVSASTGTPASIGASMTIAKAQGLNEANVRAEYARWRKFHGISGRIAAPEAPAAAPSA
jgi:membrane protein involved in colicin uptake